MLRPQKIFPLFALATLVATSGCTKKDPAPTAKDASVGYADLVYATYSDTLAATVGLKSAVDRFLEAPSAGRLEYAKRAWLDARHFYGQTEAFRFYGGPIDDETGPEGRVNGWPLDESYIDYVEGDADAGIVNDTKIEITKAKLTALNEGASGDVMQRGEAFDREKAIATGYHAVEFLLWGQDHETYGPGTRPWQDYLTTSEATRPNADRRRQYLAAVTDLLVDDLTPVTKAWAPDSEGYRKKFLALDDHARLRDMLTGIGVLSKGELAGERIDVALDTLDQEDEHSCFSDNTHVDIAMNALGIRNVYLGQYGTVRGPGLSALVRAKDPELDKAVVALLDRIVTDASSIPAPFDQSIKDRNGEGWKRANAVVQSLFELGDKLVVVGKALDLGNISVSLPQG